MLKRLASGASAFSTFFQVVPKLAAVIRRMRPTWHLPSLSAVDAEFLRTNGIRGLIWDVDGTLTGDRRPALEPEAAPAFRALMGFDWLKHVVLSNSSEERFRELGAIFPELTILRAYEVDGSVVYRKRRGAGDSMSDAEVQALLERGGRMIRKPSRALVEYALRELALGAGEAAMIGDQYMTDVAGANFGGVRSIKLPTIAPETFRLSVKLSQRLEKLIYAFFYGRKRS